VVTGGATGIGRASAVAFAGAGARAVVVADVDAAGGQETVDLVEEHGAKGLFVATDVGPMREIQERGQCLLLVRGDDVRDLARALGTLVSDEAARRRLTTAAADYASAESVARAAERTREAYDAAREARHG